MKLDLDGDGEREEVEAGGLPRLATLIRQIESDAGHPVAVVSSGDELTGRYFQNYKGRATYTLMNAAGYEIASFGNHEFDQGPEVLARALEYAQFPRLCTDLAVEGTPLEGHCVPWIIEDYDGLKVGYFSMITESLPYVASPNEVKLTGTNLETAHRAVRELHGAGAQLIVCISHTGFDNDLEVARSVPGIDIIYGGHSHEYTPVPHRVGSTFVVNAGTKGPYLVRMDLTTDAEGVLDLDGVDLELIPVVAPIVPAPDVEAALAGFAEAMPEAIVIGVTEVGVGPLEAGGKGRRVYGSQPHQRPHARQVPGRRGPEQRGRVPREGALQARSRHRRHAPRDRRVQQLRVPLRPRGPLPHARSSSRAPRTSARADCCTRRACATPSMSRSRLSSSRVTTPASGRSSRPASAS